MCLQTFADLGLPSALCGHLLLLKLLRYAEKAFGTSLKRALYVALFWHVKFMLANSARRYFRIQVTMGRLSPQYFGAGLRGLGVGLARAVQTYSS